jgi:hypothetical protein
MDGKVGDPKTQHRRVWAQLISHGFELATNFPEPSSPTSVTQVGHLSHYEVSNMQATAVVLTPAMPVTLA